MRPLAHGKGRVRNITRDRAPVQEIDNRLRLPVHEFFLQIARDQVQRLLSNVELLHRQRTVFHDLPALAPDSVGQELVFPGAPQDLGDAPYVSDDLAADEVALAFAEGDGPHSIVPITVAQQQLPAQYGESLVHHVSALGPQRFIVACDPPDLRVLEVAHRLADPR